MAEQEKISGCWWIFGREREHHFGSLSLDNGEITLSISTPVTRTQMETVIAGTTEPPIQPTIYGKDGDGNPITLMRCICSRVAPHPLGGACV